MKQLIEYCHSCKDGKMYNPPRTCANCNGTGLHVKASYGPKELATPAEKRKAFFECHPDIRIIQFHNDPFFKSLITQIERYGELTEGQIRGAKQRIWSLKGDMKQKTPKPIEKPEQQEPLQQSDNYWVKIIDFILEKTQTPNPMMAEPWRMKTRALMISFRYTLIKTDTLSDKQQQVVVVAFNTIKKNAHAMAVKQKGTRKSIGLAVKN